MEEGLPMGEEEGPRNIASDRNAPGHVLIELSRRSLFNHFVARDMDAACEFMSDHLDWMGPFTCQVASNLQTMKEILKPEYDTKLALADEQWKAKRYGSVWVVSAIYTVLSKIPGNETVLPFRQHATYVWARMPEGPRIVHLHVSNTTDDNAAAPPLPSDTNAIQFLYDHFDMQGSRGAKLEFRDIEGSMHFLHRNEILCVLSEGPRCRIRHTQGELIVRNSLESLIERVGEQFVRTHRSCLANKSHVVEAEGLALRLDDGSTCPMAKKRIAVVLGSLGAHGDHGI